MNIPSQTKPALWGAVGGAVALAIIGFTWGGWMTTGSAAKMANKQTETAVVAVLAPICVERFQQEPDSAGKLAALKETASYKQADIIEQGGWATMVGSEKPAPGTARACANLLNSLPL
jgi:hypothetical protein